MISASSGVLKLNSAGTQLRDFITLGDVTRAVIHFMQLEPSLIGDGLFNLGGGTLSILAMAERVRARWQALTGQNIALARPEGGDVTLALNYRCDKLFNTGFALTSEIDSEIDSTLKLCLSAFSK